MTHSATSTELPPAVADWWGNPAPDPCTVDWCPGDCVAQDLRHSRVLFEGEALDGVTGEPRRVFAVFEQTGGEQTVYLSTGDSDEHGVNLPMSVVKQLAVAFADAVQCAGTVA